MSKCMMSWCGGEREGRDMGGALATPPRENMESPDLRGEPVHSTLVHMGLTWPVPPSSRSAWCPHQRRSLGMRHTSTLCLTRQKMFQGFYQWLNEPLDYRKSVSCEKPWRYFCTWKSGCRSVGMIKFTAPLQIPENTFQFEKRAPVGRVKSDS